MKGIKLIEKYGFTEKQVRELLGGDYKNFQSWMAGQTLGLIEGIEVFYYCDVFKWMRGSI